MTRPDLFRAYFTEQIGLLIANHEVPVEIGESTEPIPVHFAYRRDVNIAASFDRSRSIRPLRDLFDTLDLAMIDDSAVDGGSRLPPGTPAPLALFRASRVDYSLHRLHHYTGTDPQYFQTTMPTRLVRSGRAVARKPPACAILASGADAERSDVRRAQRSRDSGRRSRLRRDAGARAVAVRLHRGRRYA